MRIVGYEQTLIVAEERAQELVEAGLIYICGEPSCQDTAHPTSPENAKLLRELRGVRIVEER